MSADPDSSTNFETIYVRLTNEVVSVWRPVKAKKVYDFTYEIVKSATIPDTEEWEFAPGDVVRVELQNKSDEDIFVAVERR